MSTTAATPNQDERRRKWREQHERYLKACESAPPGAILLPGQVRPTLPSQGPGRPAGTMGIREFAFALTDSEEVTDRLMREKPDPAPLAPEALIREVDVLTREYARITKRDWVSVFSRAMAGEAEQELEQLRAALEVAASTERTCEDCHELFEPTRKGQEYCKPCNEPAKRKARSRRAKSVTRNPTARNAVRRLK